MKFVEDKLKDHDIDFDIKFEVYSAALVKQLNRYLKRDEMGLIKYIESKHNAMKITDRYFKMLKTTKIIL